jgi:response regulator of citrate/malate metabolism
MSQETVMKILEHKKDWMTSTEITKMLGISSGSVVKSLNTMVKNDEVQQKLITAPIWNGRKTKHKIRIYKVRWTDGEC